MLKGYSVALFFFAFAGVAGASTPNRELLNNLPLRFEESHQQVNAAKYVAHGGNFSLFLAPDESWIDWSDTAGKRTARVRTSLVNASRAVRLEAGERLPGEANYFVGPSQDWKTGVAGYDSVHYRGVYPGIDLVFHGGGQGAKQRLEYDFVVAAHADPNVIRFDLDGQSSLRIDPGGDLVVATKGGEILWKRPELYQDIHGKRRPVTGAFVLTGRHTVGFRIGEYDHGQALVIDPTLTYSTYFGGAGNEFIRGIGVDGSGNVYLAGGTTTTTLATVSAFQPNFGGQSANLASGDAFVAKFSPAGALIYLTYLGGSADDTAMALAVDYAGNAYVTGFTTSTNFPLAGTPFQKTFGGMGGASTVMRTGDAFVTKLSPAGNKLIYSTYLGGGQDDFGLAIAIDSTGAAYITGGTSSVAFPVTPSVFQHSYFGGGGQRNTFTFAQPLISAGDAFVTKLDPTGSSLVFSTYLGSNLDDVGSAIALDANNNVFVAGFTLSSAFPTTAGAFQTKFGGADPQNQFFQTGDGFITKLKSDGSAQIYSTFFGGAGDDYVQAIVSDKAGNLYFAGSSGSARLPTTSGAFQTAFGGPSSLPTGIESNVGDAIVGKLNPTGSGLVYLTYLGGTGNDSATALAVDDDGNAYVGGFADSTNFPLTRDALQAGRDGGSGDIQFFSFGDTFLSVLDPAGAALVYSTYLGGGRDDILFGLTVDPVGKIYIAGNTLSTNFRTTPDAAQRTFGGSKNLFTFPQGDGFYSVFSPIFKGPVITGVSNAESGVALLAPNTWTAIYGRALAGPAARTWGDSDFSNNQMPTSLDGVTVTMNGKNAFVYYISPTQVSVLTPADLAPGPVQVQLTFAGASSPPFTVQAQATSPSFFVINGGPYVLATHADGKLLGPATLFPGATTPGTSGETVVVYGNGFGGVSDPVVNGSANQSGNLTPVPVIRVGSISANVRFAGLISPGLYQFNFDIPPGLPAGDNAIVAIMNGVSTPTGLLITLK